MATQPFGTKKFTMPDKKPTRVAPETTDTTGGLGEGGTGGTNLEDGGTFDPTFPGVQPPVTDPTLPPVGPTAPTLPGALFNREQFQGLNQGALQAVLGLRPGIANEQVQNEIAQFEQDLTQRGDQDRKQLEARLQQLGVLESGITGARGIDLATAQAQERGRFRTDIMGQLQRQRFGESLQATQALQGLLGQQFGQGFADAGQQQGIFQQNRQNQMQDLQAALSLLGLGGIGFPGQGGAQFNEGDAPNKSLSGPLGEIIATIIKSTVGG